MTYLYGSLLLLSSLSCAGLGILVILKPPRTVQSKLFALGAVVLFLSQLTTFFALISSYEPIALLWTRLSLIGISFVPITWTLISLSFARQDFAIALRKWKWYLSLLGLLTLFFLPFISFDSFVEEIKKETISYSVSFGSFGRYFHIFLLISILIVLVNLEDLYRRTPETRKEQIKYAVLGLMGSFAFYLYVISMALLFRSVDLETLVAWSVTIIIAMALVAYSIFKHNLMGLNLYLGRQVVYSSVTLVLAAAYLLLVGLVTMVLQTLHTEFKLFFTSLGAFILLFLLMIMLLSAPVKKQIAVFIDKNFYRRRYDYQREWEKFAQRTSSILDLKELLREIIAVITDTLYIDKASVMLLNPQKTSLYVAAAKNLPDYAQKVNIKATDKFVEWLKNSGEPIIIPPKTKKTQFLEIYQENRDNFETLQTALCVPLIADGDLIGILNLGKKHLKEDYTTEDLELLKTMARQAALAIVTAQLSEQMAISKEIESFHKVSSFIMHDLKNSVSMLSILLQNAADNFDNPEFQKDALKTISSTIARMKSLIDKLSTFPKKLELNLQPIDLNKLLQDTINKSKIAQMPEVKVIQNFNGLPTAVADYEYLQKVILNLILNALEALPKKGKREIKISSFLSDNFAHIVIADTGCGIPKEFINQQLFKPFQTTKKKGLGIGLYQCKEIIAAHGGTIEIESEEGKGTKVILRLPIA